MRYFNKFNKSYILITCSEDALLIRVPGDSVALSNILNHIPCEEFLLNLASIYDVLIRCSIAA